jgi:8-oxo-dGTP diphosphatase
MRDRSVAEALIINNKGEILLQKKTVGYPIYPSGGWSFFGGEVDEGEEAEETLKRELKEELGFIVDEFKFLYSEDYCVDGKCSGKRNVFEVKFNGKLSDLRLTEGGGFAFFDKSELKHIKILPVEICVLEKYFGIELS